ncbi:hypothetical protein B296_00042715, partial [Ensete ventricosum]
RRRRRRRLVMEKGEGSNEGGLEVRVLVVDDSPVERRMVEVLLKKSGAMFQVVMKFYFRSVIAVDSGKRAMEVLGLTDDKAEHPTVDDQKVDIILTDYSMPEMTGYDLLKTVKEQSCRKPIPVIIMSSENEPQRISRFVASSYSFHFLQSNTMLVRDYTFQIYIN